MIYYDTKAIDHDISIKDVLNYFGEKSINGKYHCINRNHHDKNPSMNIYKNKCKCFSCGKMYGPISAAMELGDYNFQEACRFLIKEFGLDIDIYAEIDDKYNQKIELKDKFPLTYQELRILNWPMGNKRLDIYDEKGNIYQTIQDMSTLKDFYKETPDLFYATLQEKINIVLLPKLKLKLFYLDYFKPIIKKYIDTYGSFDICRQMVRAYRDLKANDVVITYQKDYLKILSDLVMLEEEEKNYYENEKDLKMLKNIVSNIPKKYKDKNLETYINSICDLYIYTPKFLNEYTEYEKDDIEEEEIENEIELEEEFETLDNERE